MNELMAKYSDLDLEQKRNQINIELEIIGELIKKVEAVYNIPVSLNVKNYDIAKEKKMSEDEMLAFFYEDVFNIERELITLLTYISSLKK